TTYRCLLSSSCRDARGCSAAPATRGTAAARISRQMWTVRRLPGLDEPVARKLSAKVVAGVADLVAQMAADPEHATRLRFDDYVAGFIDRLHHDQALRHKVGELRDRLLDDPALPRYVRGLWDQVLAWLREDLAREDSRIAARATRAAQ